MVVFLLHARMWPFFRFRLVDDMCRLSYGLLVDDMVSVYVIRTIVCDSR